MWPHPTSERPKTMRYSYLGWIPVLALVLLAGCESPTPRERPEAPEEPPPPTPEELAMALMADMQLDGPLPRPGSSLTPAVRQNILDVLKQKKVELAVTVEGKRALAIVQHRLNERVRDFERAELWEHVLAYTDAHLILDPESTKFDHTRENALVELRKPRVTLSGLPEFEGRKIAFLTFYLPMTSESHKERMAIGEVMYGIRLLGIFGRDRGVRLEYLETGERFVAYLPAAM